jgi:hypothetical protein
VEFDRLAAELGSVDDPRDRRGLLHPLVTVLAIPILAMLCGRDGADGAHMWGLKNEAWLRAFLPLPHGIPSQDAMLRVYAAVDTRQLEVAFVSWMAHFARLLEDGRQVATISSPSRGIILTWRRKSPRPPRMPFGPGAVPSTKVRGWSCTGS